MKVNKKKVSFDIEADTLESIKEYCVNNGVKQSDFYRAAAIEHFDKVNNNKELIYFDNIENKAVKLNVPVPYYDFESYDADDDTRAVLGVKKIVIVKDKGMSNGKNRIDKYLAANGGVLKCFEK